MNYTTFRNPKTCFDVAHYDDTMFVYLSYPSNDVPQYVQIGINRVRAFNDVRIYFDFKRDKWVVEENIDIYTNGEHDKKWIERASFEETDYPEDEE